MDLRYTLGKLWNKDILRRLPGDNEGILKWLKKSKYVPKSYEFLSDIPSGELKAINAKLREFYGLK